MCKTVILATIMAVVRTVFFQIDVAINQDLKALFPKSMLDSEYLFHWLNFHQKKREALSNGSTVKDINLK